MGQSEAGEWSDSAVLDPADPESEEVGHFLKPDE